jgi:hypothetical protein
MASYVPGELIPWAFVWLDPGITPCVKTHTFAKCGKHNSRHRTSRVQYDFSEIFLRVARALEFPHSQDPKAPSEMQNCCCAT